MTTKTSNDDDRISNKRPQELHASNEITHQTMREFLARLRLTDWIVAIGTVIIAGATFWNVLVLKSGEHDTTRLSKATADLSVYAERQALMDRPWVGVSSMGLTDDSVGQQRYKSTKQWNAVITPEDITKSAFVGIGIKNGGKFVAHMNSFKLNSGVSASFPVHPPYGPEHDTGSDQHYGTGHDTGSTVVLPDMPILNYAHAYFPTNAEKNDIVRGTKTYFIFAEIEYTELPSHIKDSLGHTISNVQSQVIRTTRICFSYSPVMHIFQNCSGYNSAD